MGDEHQLVQQLASNLWFRHMDYVRDERGHLVRRSSLSIEEVLKNMALKIKPHANLWLYLSPRLCPLGKNAFDYAPAVVREIHQYLQRRYGSRQRRRCWDLCRRLTRCPWTGSKRMCWPQGPITRVQMQFSQEWA